MTRIGGRTIEVGRSTDIDNGEGYSIEYNDAANQLDIIDKANDNVITIDIGKTIIAEALDASSELKLPVYADNTEATAEDSQLWFNDGSGPDAAGLYHFDGSIIGPLETGSGSAPGSLSGLTIDTDKDLGGFKFTGAGHNELDVPQVKNLTVADFESGTLDTDVFSGDTGSFTVQSSIVDEGDFALQSNPSSSGIFKLISETGLGSYPQRGDAVQYRINLSDTDDSSQFIYFLNGVDRVRVTVSARKNNVRVDVTESGSNTTKINGSVNISNFLNEFLTVSLEIGDKDTRIIVFDSTGSEIFSDSFTHGLESGAIAFQTFNSNISPTITFDNVTLKRNSVDYLTETKKGTTQLGNEVVPSGGIQTGPSEVPADHPNYPMVNLPVTDKASQGDQVGYHLAIDEQKALTVEAEADGTGGTLGGPIMSPPKSVSLLYDDYRDGKLENRDGQKQGLGITGNNQLGTPITTIRRPEYTNPADGTLTQKDNRIGNHYLNADNLELPSNIPYGSFKALMPNEGAPGGNITFRFSEWYLIRQDSNNWVRLRQAGNGVVRVTENVAGSTSTLIDSSNDGDNIVKIYPDKTVELYDAPSRNKIGSATLSQLPTPNVMRFDTVREHAFELIEARRLGGFNL